MKKLFILSVAFCVTFLAGITSLPVSAQDPQTAAVGDSILNIPAAAFNESTSYYEFENDGYVLDLRSGSGEFNASLNLPRGSIIKKIILVCWDQGGSDITLYLRRAFAIGLYEEIAYVSSSGSDNEYRAFSQRLTSKKYVNTFKHSHFLTLFLPGTGSAGYYFSKARIVYTPPTS